MRFFSGLILPILLLSGCASLSEEECAGGNWELIGRNDAIQGLERSRLSDHTKACAKYQIVPDEALYVTGYETGLVTYCTPSRGFNVGRNGYEYRSICPAESEPSFLRGYERGKALHDIETAIAEARSQLTDVQTKIDKIGQLPKDDRDRAALTTLYDDEDRLEEKLQRLTIERHRALLLADRFLQTISPEL